MTGDHIQTGSRLFARVLGMLLLSVLMGRAAAQVDAPDFLFTRGLIIRSAPGYPDNIAAKDPIEAALVSGTWRAPEPGDSVR